MISVKLAGWPAGQPGNYMAWQKLSHCNFLGVGHYKCQTLHDGTTH